MWVLRETNKCVNFWDFYIDLPASLSWLKVFFNTDSLMLDVLLKPFRCGNGKLWLGALFLNKYWNISYINPTNHLYKNGKNSYIIKLRIKMQYL
jgi:hypothetical protein